MTLLTKKQVAQIFSVSERTIYNWEKNKILSAVTRINKRPRYSKEEIDQLIQSQRTN